MQPTLLKRATAALFRATHRRLPPFRCPLCAYDGPFQAANQRAHARCPQCSALERHRLQCLVMEALGERLDLGTLDVIHFAPEKHLAALLRSRFRSYVSADLSAPGVDYRVDLRTLPFPDASFDVVVASHVLEHITDDITALRQIRRILRPGGAAVLPVPLIGRTTVEYPAPNARECGHVRAPGYDYFERYEPIFARVEQFSSAGFDERFQPWVYEDRSRWPTPDYPHRLPSPGERHVDVVPVCWA